MDELLKPDSEFYSNRKNAVKPKAASTGTTPTPTTKTKLTEKEKQELLKKKEADLKVSIREDLGIKTDTRYYNAFNTYKNYESIDVLDSGIGYFFFTKPQLNLSDQSTNALKIHFPFINSYRDKSAYSDMFSGNGYVYPLTNLGLGFDTHDIVMETDEYSSTFRGYKMIAPTTTVKSEIAGDFSITYLETSDMYVTTYHKIWMDYISGVRQGILKPVPGAIKGLSNKTGASRNGYIDYMNSVYYFLLDPDGQTIKYWAKYTGVFPTNIPYSAFKWELGTHETRKLTVNYSYNYKEDMNPILLEEFNRVSGITTMGTSINEKNKKYSTKAQVVVVDGRYKLKL